MADIAADLELSVRAQNCLRANGVRTLDDFLHLSEHRVMQWRNAGRRTWNEIRDVQANLRRTADSSTPAINAAACALDALNIALAQDRTLRAYLKPDGSVGLSRIIGV